LRAAAGHHELTVPSRSRLPAAGRREHAAAAPVNPDAAAVEAPGPALDACRFRGLLDHAHATPVARHRATQHAVLRAAVGNDLRAIARELYAWPIRRL